MDVVKGISLWSLKQRMGVESVQTENHHHFINKGRRYNVIRLVMRSLF